MNKILDEMIDTYRVARLVKTGILLDYDEAKDIILKELNVKEEELHVQTMDRP